jgi:hypothetical protein
VRQALLHLLFCEIVEYDVARICVDGQDLPPVADDYKIQVRVAGRKSTRAVRIYGVGARNIHWLGCSCVLRADERVTLITESSASLRLAARHHFRGTCRPANLSHCLTRLSRSALAKTELAAKLPPSC